MSIKDNYLNPIELAGLYHAAINGTVSKNDLSETERLQLLKFAKDKKQQAIQGISESIAHGTITPSKYNFDLDAYIKTQYSVNAPQSVIDWLNETEVNGISQNRFYLTGILNGGLNENNEYRNYKKQVEMHGYVLMKLEQEQVRIYTAEMAYILASKQLTANNLDTDTEVQINGFEYLKAYVKAYREGEQYFESEFKVSPNTLYGENAKQYVSDLHLNFFHVKHTQSSFGWVFVKNSYPFILTENAVKEYGFYSGIVNKLEEQISKYPKQFAHFDKCEHSAAQQQTITEPDAVSFENNFCNTELSNRQKALIMIYEGKSITHKDGGVYKHRMLNSRNDRLAEPQNKKAYKDFVNDLIKAIENLQGNSKQKAIDDLNTYESKYKNEYT